MFEFEKSESELRLTLYGLLIIQNEKRRRISCVLHVNSNAVWL